MKILSSTLTIALKFIFFVTFTFGVLTLSILNTYLSRDYYENHFADKFVAIQSEQVENALDEQTSTQAFAISKESITKILKETFTKENIITTVNSVFDSIENYEGDTIVIDLTPLKSKEDEFINKLINETTSSPSLQRDAKIYLKKHINFEIPPSIEIETQDTTIDKVVRALQFILTRKLAVNSIIIIIMWLPLIGIFALNAHPFYNGIRKASYSLIVAGAFTSCIMTLSKLIIKWLYANATIKITLEEAAVSMSEGRVLSIFNLAFGGMFEIMTVTGIITLGVGIIFYVISKVLQNRHEYSY